MQFWNTELLEAEQSVKCTDVDMFWLSQDKSAATYTICTNSESCDIFLGIQLWLREIFQSNKCLFWFLIAREQLHCVMKGSWMFVYTKQTVLQNLN